MTSSASLDLVVICDWLNVTFAPKDCPYPEVNRLLLDSGFVVLPSKGSDTRIRYSCPSPAKGMVVIEHRSRWAAISASGGACAHLRYTRSWMDYLSALSSSPHCVTRLDAALDLAVDGADFLASLAGRYPSGEVNLGRKAIRITEFLSTRRDGRKSGTWYAGYKSGAKATARVYDKALELLEKDGQEVSPRSRVEITAWKGYGATLRDASEPASLFWHVASPALLQAPEGTPVWQPDTEFGWQSAKPDFDPAALLRRRVENLSELDALALIADELGPMGRSYLMTLIEKRLAIPAAVQAAS